MTIFGLQIAIEGLLRAGKAMGLSSTVNLLAGWVILLLFCQWREAAESEGETTVVLNLSQRHSHEV